METGELYNKLVDLGQAKKAKAIWNEFANNDQELNYKLALAWAQTIYNQYYMIDPWDAHAMWELCAPNGPVSIAMNLITKMNQVNNVRSNGKAVLGPPASASTASKSAPSIWSSDSNGPSGSQPPAGGTTPGLHLPSQQRQNSILYIVALVVGAVVILNFLGVKVDLFKGSGQQVPSQRPAVTTSMPVPLVMATSPPVSLEGDEKKILKDAADIFKLNITKPVLDLSSYVNKQYPAGNRANGVIIADVVNERANAFPNLLKEAKASLGESALGTDTKEKLGKALDDIKDSLDLMAVSSNNMEKDWNTAEAKAVEFDRKVTSVYESLKSLGADPPAPTKFVQVVRDLKAVADKEVQSQQQAQPAQGQPIQQPVQVNPVGPVTGQQIPAQAAPPVQGRVIGPASTPIPTQVIPEAVVGGLVVSGTNWVVTKIVSGTQELPVAATKLLVIADLAYPCAGIVGADKIADMAQEAIVEAGKASGGSPTMDMVWLASTAVKVKYNCLPATPIPTRTPVPLTRVPTATVYTWKPPTPRPTLHTPLKIATPIPWSPYPTPTWSLGRIIPPTSTILWSPKPVTKTPIPWSPMPTATLNYRPFPTPTLNYWPIPTGVVP